SLASVAAPPLAVADVALPPDLVDLAESDFAWLAVALPFDLPEVLPLALAVAALGSAALAADLSSEAFAAGFLALSFLEAAFLVSALAFATGFLLLAVDALALPEAFAFAVLAVVVLPPSALLLADFAAGFFVGAF